MLAARENVFLGRYEMNNSREKASCLCGISQQGTHAGSSTMEV